MLFVFRHILFLVLVTFLSLFSQAFPPVIDHEARFRTACERTCAQDRDVKFCAAYCGCMIEGLAAENLLADAFSRTPSDAFRGRLRDMADLCTAQTEGSVGSGGAQ